MIHSSEMMLTKMILQRFYKYAENTVEPPTQEPIAPGPQSALPQPGQPESTKTDQKPQGPNQPQQPQNAVQNNQQIHILIPSPIGFISIPTTMTTDNPFGGVNRPGNQFHWPFNRSTDAPWFTPPQAMVPTPFIGTPMYNTFDPMNQNVPQQKTDRPWYGRVEFYRYVKNQEKEKRKEARQARLEAQKQSKTNTLMDLPEPPQVDLSEPTQDIGLT